MSSDTIVCRTTSWYHKRRIAMLVMVFGFCIYFIYDWRVGYPQKRAAVAAWLEKKKELAGESVDPKDIDSAKTKEIDAAYARVAAERGLPEEVDKKKLDLNHWDFQINYEQPGSAVVSGVLGLIMLFFYIRTTRSRLTADGESFTPPNGERVPFASAFRIDRRKWDHKGLAYVYYKDGEGKERRAVIDDLIYGGASKVLERLEANFKGEIIDLAKEEPAEEEENAEQEESKDSAESDDRAPAAAAEDTRQAS